METVIMEKKTDYNKFIVYGLASVGASAILLTVTTLGSLVGKTLLVVGLSSAAFGVVKSFNK